MDRRVGRTRRRLKEALLALMRERGFEAVTIRELTERADVGRSTFYSHFASKEELLFDQFDGWLLSLSDADRPATAEGDSTDRTFRFSLPLLRHAASDKRLFRTVVGSARVRRRVTRLLTEVARRELARRAAPAALEALDPDAALDARAHAVAGAFMGITAWWMDATRDVAPEAVDALFQSAVG